MVLFPIKMMVVVRIPVRIQTQTLVAIMLFLVQLLIYNTLFLSVCCISALSILFSLNNNLLPNLKLLPLPLPKVPAIQPPYFHHHKATEIHCSSLTHLRDSHFYTAFDEMGFTLYSTPYSVLPRKKLIISASTQLKQQRLIKNPQQQFS